MISMLHLLALAMQSKQMATVPFIIDETSTWARNKILEKAGVKVLISIQSMLLNCQHCKWRKMCTRTPIVVQRKLTGQKPKIIRFMKALSTGRGMPSVSFFFLFFFWCFFVFFFVFFFSKSGFRFSCQAVLSLVSLRGLLFCFCFRFFFVCHSEFCN